MLSPIPSSCPYTQLVVLATVPRILMSFFPSHVQILFYTDRIESVEWQDLVPRQRTDGLFRDSLFLLRALRSAVIKSPNFSARGRASPVCLLEGALVILVRKQASQFWPYGK